VSRRSRFAGPAEHWLRNHAGRSAVFTKDFWEGLSRERPDLTTPTENRKTPKATCMRDLRQDPVFVLGAGKIALREWDQ
jgi:hypothetical protein